MSEDLKKYYQRLIIAQYHSLPKAEGVVGTLVGEAIADQIFEQVGEAYDVDTAVGAQLDVLAKYRGLSRNVYGVDLDKKYFSLQQYGDTDPLPGLSLYPDDISSGIFITYSDSSRKIYQLTDDQLRRLIKFAAKVQSMGHDMKAIDDVMYEFFGVNATVYDNENMTGLYVHLESDDDILFTVVAALGLLPRPAGVKIWAINADSLSGFFALVPYGETLPVGYVGLSQYGTPQAGSFVRY